MAQFLKKLFPYANLKETAQRFALSTVCITVLFGMMLAANHGFLNDDDDFTGKIMLSLGCGYFWFGIARLVAESRSLNPGKHLILALSGFAAIGTIIFSYAEPNVYMLFLVPTLLLAIMVAPFTKDGDDLSFWFFNRVTWFGVAMGILAAVVWAGGLSAALGSIDYLFNVDVHHKVYEDLWMFSCTIFGPLYALSWVPTKFSFREEDCNDPPGLAFMLNWVLAPLIVVYMLILYAYLVKIMIVGEVPRGQLAYMVTGFGGVGVVTYLMGWPLRERGGVLLRLVHRWFFPALIIPVILQALAVWMRIEQYGLTEQRYAICVTVVWFAVISLLFAHKQFPLKIIPGLLAVLFFLSSFGPWGAMGLSGISQFNRLEALLMKNNILQNGEIVKVESAEKIPIEDRKSISSILDYLSGTKRTKWLTPWFEGPGETWMFSSSSAATKEMGFEYVSSWEPEYDKGYFNFSAPPEQNVLGIGGFQYLINFYAYAAQGQEWKQSWVADEKSGRPEIDAKVLGGILTVTARGAGEVALDVASYAQKEYERDPSTPRNMQLEAESGSLKVRAVFLNISGNVEDNKTNISNMNVQLLIAVD